MEKNPAQGSSETPVVHVDRLITYVERKERIKAGRNNLSYLARHISHQLMSQVQSLDTVDANSSDYVYLQRVVGEYWEFPGIESIRIMDTHCDTLLDFNARWVYDQSGREKDRDPV